MLRPPGVRGRTPVHSQRLSVQRCYSLSKERLVRSTQHQTLTILNMFAEDLNEKIISIFYLYQVVTEDVWFIIYNN